MSFQQLNNGESGSVIRQKLNSMLNTLFNSNFGLWGKINEEKIIPLNDMPVEAPSVTVTSQLRVPYLGGFPELSKSLMVDNEGFLQVDESTEAGEATWGHGNMYLFPGNPAVSVDLQRPNIFIGQSVTANTDIQLPLAIESNTAEVYVKKLANNAYAVTINSDFDETRHNHNVGNGITTTDPGAYIRLKAVKQSEILAEWIVMEIHGTWTLI